MKHYYHCPRCLSNDTERAILIDAFDDIRMSNGETYNPEKHGSPYQCNICRNVFVVGIEKITYSEHIKKCSEEMNR